MTDSNEDIVDTTEYFEGKDGQWYWHAKSNNGKIIADGGGYNTWENAEATARQAFPNVEPTKLESASSGGDGSSEG